MSVFKRPTSGNYFASLRCWMQDSRLSLKARGLLALMLSMPPEWEFTQADLVKRMPDGKAALRAAMKECVKYGYLIRQPQKRGESGKFSDAVCNVYDSPQIEEPLSDDMVANIFSLNPNWDLIKKMFPKSDFRTARNRTLEDKEIRKETEESCFVAKSGKKEVPSNEEKEESLTKKGVPVVIASKAGVARHSVQALVERIKLLIPDVKPKEAELAIEQAREKPGHINNIDKYLEQIILNQRADKLRKEAREKRNAKLSGNGRSKPKNGDDYYYKFCEKAGKHVKVPISSNGEK